MTPRAQLIGPARAVTAAEVSVLADRLDAGLYGLDEGLDRIGEARSALHAESDALHAALDPRAKKPPKITATTPPEKVVLMIPPTTPAIAKPTATPHSATVFGPATVPPPSPHRVF